MNNNEIVCKFCGKTFGVVASRLKTYKSRHPVKHCSRECYYKGKTVLQKRKCKICGKIFLAKPSQIKKGGGIYCSWECMHKGHETGYYKKCEVCGKLFWTTKYKAKHGDGRFCSWNCKNKWVDTKITKKCEVCGRDFLTKPSRFKRGWGRFCSVKCMRVWFNKSKARTKIEKIIEKELLSQHLIFSSQYPLLTITIPDFYIPERSIAIYCDGDYWHSLPNAKKRDNTQDLILGLHGYKVFRFSETEINKSPKRCVDKILRYIKKQEESNG